MTPAPRGRAPRARLLFSLLLAAVVSALLAGCSLANLPVAEPTPTPCPANCPPPVANASAAHTVNTRYFSLVYYDPWSEDNTTSTATTLVAGTQLGDIEVVIAGTRVSAGTTSDQLLNQTMQNQLDPNQFSGLQDGGPILGAEIGYVSGSGRSFAGYASQANSPSTPIFIQMMASVQGTTGLTFTTVSPLDPNSPDPSVVPSEEYDRIANSVVWK